MTTSEYIMDYLIKNFKFEIIIDGDKQECLLTNSFVCINSVYELYGFVFKVFSVNGEEIHDVCKSFYQNGLEEFNKNLTVK